MMHGLKNEPTPAINAIPKFTMEAVLTAEPDPATALRLISQFDKMGKLAILFKVPVNTRIPSKIRKAPKT